MIEHKTIVDQVSISRDGTIQVRLGLLLVDGDVELDCKWHRTSVDPGGSVDAALAAVNANLVQMGRAQVPAEQLLRLKDVASAVHTTKTIDAFKAARAAKGKP